MPSILDRTGPLSRLEAKDQMYLATRWFIDIILVTFYFPFLRSAFMSPVYRYMYVAATAVCVLTSAAITIAYFSNAKRENIIWWALPPDLLSIGLLVASVATGEDPFFILALALAVFYAIAVRDRRMWLAAGPAAAIYVSAHVLAHPHGRIPAAVSFFVVNGLGILAVSALVWWIVRGMERRAVELKRSHDSTETLNLQLKRTVSELRAVSEITEIIHSTLDFEEVGPLVLDTVQKALGVPACSLFVINKSKAETLFSATRGATSAPFSGVREMVDNPATGTMSRSGEDLFSCTTLLDHKDMMVVFCAPADLMESMGEDDRLVLQAVASELVVAVENSQLYKLTKRMAITDELTGLYNYRYLQQRLDDEYERAKRYSRNLSMLMLDVDKFKNFNDTYGHLAGDEALAEIGDVMRSAVREIDVVCRYGGEEFSVILPETDAAGAFVVAEKIREAISTHEFADADGTRGCHLTVSIGLATFPLHARDKEGMLRQADDALYKAKDHGRDRVRAPSRPGYLLGDEDDETEQDNVGDLGVSVDDDETIEFGVGAPTGDYADEATGE